jgi:hypothetical protein
MNTTYPTALTVCESCGSSHEWTWADAFDKFGFGDGDGLVMTSSVADILIAAGYAVETVHWGMHNVIISSIKRDGVEQIPAGTTIGYDDPRGYLPAEIVSLLDCKVIGEF